MNSKTQVGGLLLVSALGGVLAGNLLCASMPLRSALSVWCGRGPLVACCEGVGLYRADLLRAQAELESRIPDINPNEEEPTPVPAVSLGEIALNLEAEQMARQQAVPPSSIERELELLRFQWQPQKWLAALRASALSARSLRCLVARELRTRSWMEDRIQAGLRVSPEECAAFYNAHLTACLQPLRVRASHIFLAAPPESDAELVEKKDAAAQALLDRLGRGEKFADLMAASEDEASKKHGGDLNYFCEKRMPPDFWAQIKDRRVGETSGVLRTKLGFHIVQLTDARPPRQMSLEEARPEIFAILENEKRTERLASLAKELNARIRWNKSSLGGSD